MDKLFFITIDTEGDNLWEWKKGDTVCTENTKYLYRFQTLCEKYGFKPIYLTNYEMAMDDEFVRFAKNAQYEQKCEVGMHLHAWNSPPEDVEIPVREHGEVGAPFLIEYPDHVMENKIKFITSLLEEKFGMRPVSHRAGRWAMNSTYFRLLSKYNYKFDCSVTPGVDWSVHNGQSEESKGSDYSDAKLNPYRVPDTNIIEVPVSVRKMKMKALPEKYTVKNIFRSIKHFVKEDSYWVRPNNHNLNECIKLIDKISIEQNNQYIMFMLHSSELMPGGSPTFKRNSDIEELYQALDVIFENVKKRGYVGTTFRDILEGKFDLKYDE